MYRLWRAEGLLRHLNVGWLEEWFRKENRLTHCVSQKYSKKFQLQAIAKQRAVKAVNAKAGNQNDNVEKKTTARLPLQKSFRIL